MKLFLIILFITTSIVYADNNYGSYDDDDYPQDTTLHPHNLSLRIGFPNILGFGYQYDIPVGGFAISPHLDLSILPVTSTGGGDNNGRTYTDNEEITYKYFMVGADFFLNKEAKGLFAGVGIEYILLDQKSSSQYDNAAPSRDSESYIYEYNEKLFLAKFKAGGKRRWDSFFMTFEGGVALPMTKSKDGTNHKYFDNGTIEENYGIALGDTNVWYHVLFTIGFHL